MKNQIIGRFLLAFIIATTASSTAQEKNVKDIPELDEVTFPHDATKPKFAPRGIFAIVPWRQAPEDYTWKNPCVEGVTIRRYWEKLNPAQGVYDWTELKSMFALAHTHSKKIHLIIAPGFYSPPWVLDSLDATEKTDYFIVPHGPKRNEKWPLPLPWSSVYLNYWFTFVDTLAEEFGPDSALSFIAVTGPNSHNGEVNLPTLDKNKPGTSNYDPLEKWKRLAGGGPNAEKKLMNKMLGAYKKTLDHFHKAFAGKHEKYYSLQIFNESLPVKNVGGLPSPIQQAYQDSLIALATAEPGKYFVLMNGGLDAWPIAGVVSKRYPDPHSPPPQWLRIQSLSADGYVTGFQTKDPDDDDSAPGTPQPFEIFRLTIKNGIRFSAGFLEIFEDDIHDERFKDLTVAGSVLLGGKRNCE
jgi:hypothetical protein